MRGNFGPNGRNEGRSWAVPDLISVDDARARVIAAARARGPLEPEEVALEAAAGRVLAEPARAGHDVPPFDSSAMDGFALVAGEAGELEVVGEARAGHPFAGRVEPGRAVVISTGAPVPEGADAVIPVERTEAAGGERVRVPAVGAGANVRRAGEDLRAGDEVVRAGSVLGAAEVGVLASLGLGSVACARQPRVALLVTGDELASPGEPLGPGRIYGSNDYALAAQAEGAGALVVLRERVRDDARATRKALASAIEAAEMVVVSGGVSVGPHDHVKHALAELGAHEEFWGLRLKPGKPCWFGTRGPVLVLGVPGNPVSAMVTFQLLGVPALRALAGSDPAPARASATLAVPVRRSPDREQAIRVRLREDGDGGRLAEPTGEQGSHRLTSMLGADGLARIPAGEGELPAGGRVEVELLPR